jgi:hypothetical protein
LLVPPSYPSQLRRTLRIQLWLLIFHCTATDKQAREEAERAFLSYVRTTLATAIKVPAAGSPGQQRYAHAQFEAADPDQLSIDYLVDNDMCIVGSPRHLHQADRAHAGHPQHGPVVVHDAVLADPAPEDDELDQVVR